MKFDTSGNFKIVQFSDIQDGPDTDPRTIALMNKILDYEKPNLVILGGDNVDGKCKSIRDVKRAISNISKPMEDRNIRWAIVFGNHDEDHHKMTKEEMMNFYMTFKNNINKIGYKTSDRIGNHNILVYGSKDTSPALNIFLLDSGRYAPFFIGGYSYIKLAQIHWYKKISSDLKLKYSRIIPSLMFFHIPLKAFKKAWKTGLIDGDRLENESCSKINTGLFHTIVKTKDVSGVFVGHDHLNSYCAALDGIRLGFSRNIGYGTYGKKGVPRGARVFLINESDPVNFKTWMRQEWDAELNNV